MAAAADPKKDTFGDKRLAVALQGRNAVEQYPFPGVDGLVVGVRLLSEEELDDVRLKAAAFCKRKQVDLIVDPEFFDRAIHRYTVLGAYVVADNEDKPFFEDFNQVLTIDPLLMRTLYELYLAHAQALDPLAFVSKEEVDAIVAALGKSEGSVARMSLFDRPTLLSFVLSMAHLQRAQSPTHK